MFGKKKPAFRYDPARQKPVLRCSICTGEQVACLQDRRTGQLEEIMLIRTPQELAAFRAGCSLPAGAEIEKIY